MRIAVACNGDEVADHFGHCENFLLADLEKGSIAEKKYSSNPGHLPGFLSNYLKDHQVNLIITGGIGVKAVKMFEKNGIKVIMGIEGKAEDAICDYLSGKLESSEASCRGHQDREECEH